MDAAEIRWRFRSAIRDQIDLARVPFGLIPRLPETSSVPLSSCRPGFSCTPVTRDDWRGTESEMLSRWSKRLINKANKIVDNRLSYFDLQDVDHGNPINWHRDHSAGLDVPVRLSVLTNYRDFAEFGDCKLVWEPNRHHQLVVLARAYIATDDFRYAKKASELIRSWIDANPFGYGMNWKSPLEIGIRLINWVWAIDLLIGSRAIGESLWRDIQGTVYLAVWEIRRKYSRGSSANNHVIGEAAGVFFASCYFQNFPNSNRWADEAQGVLEREIQRQTFVDGCTKEHAFGYQYFVIQFLIICMRAGEESGRPFSSQFKSRLHSMFQFLNELSLDTGGTPQMGDCDDGYVLDLGELPSQARDFLSVGAYIFDDSSLVSSATSESVFWMTGQTSQHAPEHRQTAESKAFFDSGYFLLRSRRMSVLFDCAALGHGNLAAHGHADCLSILLSVDGDAIFVDPGTYDYFTYPEARSYFRGTRAHNTAEIDGRSQSEMLGPFLWGRPANAKVLEWEDENSYTTAHGEHDGYMALSDPVLHRRKLCLDKADNELLIVDRFSASAPHTVRLHFHLDPSCDIELISTNNVRISNQQNAIFLRSSAARLELIRANPDIEIAWFSNGYHKKEPSTCIVFEQDMNTDCKIESVVTLDSKSRF